MANEKQVAALALVACLAACRSSAGPATAAPTRGQPLTAAASADLGARAISGGPAERLDATPLATLGKVAPDFELQDHAGLARRLSDFLGKPVVLEWFNPNCPYVVGEHSDGALRDDARELAAKGVVWLAVNSGAPGEAGSSLEENLAARALFAMDHPLLFDPTGAVGRAYQARSTPHLFVIDAKGVLVYSGAIDNSQEPGLNERIDYVRRALEEMQSGPVSIARTRPFGCFVNYVDASADAAGVLSAPGALRPNR